MRTVRAPAATASWSYGPCTCLEFWTDDVSLLDPRVADASRIHGPRQLTDLYLLALAVRRDGCFVTFDASVPASAIKGAEKRHMIIL